MRQLAIALGVAILLATVFTAWTPATLNPGELANQLVAALGRTGEGTATPGFAALLPTSGGPLRVGIVAGHSGLHPETGFVDPGSICPDGLTELEVNEAIAQLTVQGLQARGYIADLLQEWDPHLDNYRAVALISIHADSCVPINEQATGYKVAAAVDTKVPDRAQRLVTCIVDRYAKATGLTFHRGSITRDMTEYHTFYEINELTPAVIIEVGFLYLDREFLTKHADLIAQGIIDGVECYVNNEPASVPASGGS
jgi:N-acetylmuramoyl-L-alanine amidase